MLTKLYFLLGILAMLILIALGVSLHKHYSTNKSRCMTGKTILLTYIAVALQTVICLTAFMIFRHTNIQGHNDSALTEPLMQATLETTFPATEATVAPTDDIRLSFRPKATLLSNPSNYDITWDIHADGKIVDNFSRETPICFELDQEYFALPGVATFRGNHYRDNASYGAAVIEDETMDVVWSNKIGYLNNRGGCAWPGQPLLVQWDEETKAVMNLFDGKKAKAGLVEVIYATVDGYIHFYDLDDGSKTRNPIYMGINFKGSGTLDPRGYPLFYVGSGVYMNNEVPRMFVVDLITGNIIYEYCDDHNFAYRDWSAFNSSPLVDAETDTLIWAGENGVLYTIKLNTDYDQKAGIISVNPDAPVKTRYTSYYSEEEGRYLGYESSPAIVDQYLFISENGGLFQCVNLNTMKLIWAQDTKDDSNSSPVFQWGEDGKGYLYTAPSLHWNVNGHDGAISIYKLDAATGEILWEYQRECVRYDDIAGGVQCTPLLGREGTNIGGLVIYSISRTPSAYRGILIALDTETGEKIWEISSGNYAWSSPTALYTEDGHAYIFLANASGIARLIDGSTGEVLDTLDFGETVDASPVVFNNMVVIGTREGVYGVKIS